MGIFVNARFLTQPVSGVQRYGIECSRQIKKLHNDITFISPGNILHKDIANELNAKVIGRNTGHLWEQKDLPLFMKKQLGAPLLNLANTAPLFYRNNFITIHDLAFYYHPEWNSKKFSAWYNFLIPRLARRSRHIFTVSKTIKDEIADNYKIAGDKITVTYNGISQRMTNSHKDEKPAKEKIIFSVGTFNQRKNHQNLIAAFIESGMGKNYQLVITGDKNKVFSETSLDEELLENSNVKIYSALSEDDLISMFQKAELVVSTSLYEGFGIPLLEGLYNGCRIVCSDIPVYRELYDGHASFCDPLNIKSIVSALTDTVKMQGSVTDSGAKLLFTKYSYKQSAQLILEQILLGES